MVIGAIHSVNWKWCVEWMAVQISSCRNKICDFYFVIRCLVSVKCVVNIIIILWIDGFIGVTLKLSPATKEPVFLFILARENKYWYLIKINESTTTETDVLFSPMLLIWIVYSHKWWNYFSCKVVLNKAIHVQSINVNVLVLLSNVQVWYEGWYVANMIQSNSHIRYIR